MFLRGLCYANTLPCCVYAESSMVFQCFEPEDDKPSSGVFASSGEQVLLVLLSRLNVHSMQSVILSVCLSIRHIVVLFLSE